MRRVECSGGDGARGRLSNGRLGLPMPRLARPGDSLLQLLHAPPLLSQLLYPLEARQPLKVELAQQQVDREGRMVGRRRVGHARVAKRSGRRRMGSQNGRGGDRRLRLRIGVQSRKLQREFVFILFFAAARPAESAMSRGARRALRCDIPFEMSDGGPAGGLHAAGIRAL